MKTVNNQSENLRDFVKKQNFLLIIDSVANGNSMLRGLNRGIEDSENIDIVNGKTLNLDRIAEELVMAYAAFYEPEKHYQVIDFQVGTASIYRLIKAGNLSFVPCESWNLDTAGEILRVLDQLRMNQMKQDKISAGGLKIGELVLLQKKYEDGLRAEGKMDLPMLLEQAISVLKEIEGGGKKDIGYLLPYMELDVGVLPNPEWSLKEQEFLELLERVSGRSFTHLFVQAQNAAAPKYHFFKGYGVVNEVRYVVEKILGESICYGDVALIYGAPNYENVIRSVFENERIPYYFQKGLHALTDDHVKLLYDCIQFAREDYSYKVLRKVVYNPVFHIKKKEDGKKKRYKAKRGYSRVLKQGIGWGRQRYLDFFEWYDKWYNGTYVEFSQEEREKEEDVRLFVEFLKELIEVFDKERCDEIFAALLKLMHKYTITYMVGRVKDSEEGPINLYSQAIHPQLKQQCQAFALLDKGSDDYLLLYQQYLKQLTIGMPDDAGAVELVPYGSRKYFDRKYLFVVGLANETVEKTQTESPVLSDVELKSCVDGVIDVAAERNKRNRERFEDTLKWFPGNDIYLGFSVFDEVKLLENTPASIYMELLKRAETAEEEVEIIGYDISMVNTEKLTKERFYEEFEELIRRRQEEEKVEKANEESQMHGTNEADEVNWFDEEDLESLDDEDDWDDEEDEEDWDDEEDEEDWDDEEDEEDWDDEEGEEDWDDEEDEEDWDDEEDEEDWDDEDD
ncbi:MAG: hypothetical protein IJ794_04265, partial [Lachnospiraceae bacterium]|nr:hypothetical protein [Lachnospiraceae bacterium]